MRYPSIRGLGARYLISLILPLSGIVLVIWTLAQIILTQFSGQIARAVPAGGAKTSISSPR